MKKLTNKLIKKLPKVELHCHLDGSLRVDTIIDLAKKNNIDLPTVDENRLNKLISLKSQKISLEKYIALFDITLSVMQNKNSLERISYELMEDLSNDNVVYAEIRFSPILHTKNNLTIDDALICKNWIRAGFKTIWNKIWYYYLWDQKHRPISFN